ncbi:hypothetical protein N1851_019859 [Merluccius polli]|uniref:Uncharacterized protein n=1 Tax=Merluccius polli TaxID=89951 RepID=A0AA47NZ01_MERPO|nr:hypothetical protein N1851_019859 [Merluccius polli]
MPNNRCVAEQRIASLHRKLKKNSEFFEEYKAFMDNIISKGYAVQLNRDDNRVFYIPHHRGWSLNELLPGPNLTNTLVGVLLRLREEPIAMMADIEFMFYQVQVPEEDADLLRFLWWPNGNLNVPMEEYRMAVHLLGATSSPRVASYALWRTTEPLPPQTPFKQFCRTFTWMIV